MRKIKTGLDVPSTPLYAITNNGLQTHKDRETKERDAAAPAFVTGLVVLLKNDVCVLFCDEEGIIQAMTLCLSTQVTSIRRVED